MPLPASPSVRGTVDRVVIDSRKCGPGSLFVPLSGERTDGHRFLESAYAAGCRAFLVNSVFLRDVRGRGIGFIQHEDAVYVEVADTLAALHGLASFHLNRFSGLVRIGITGSNGKTTTKELLGAIFSRYRPTAMNPGNMNSESGLPLAAFMVSREHRFAIFEMAMDHRGQMDSLAGIVRPNAALITNIGRAHIGKLGSVEAIAQEKKKIFSRFSGNETAFLPEHNAWLEFLSEGIRGKIITYGVNGTPGLEKIEDAGLSGTIIRWNGRSIRLPLPGLHNALNALAAIAVAAEFGVPSDTVQEGIERVARLFGRAEVIAGRFTLVQDCYNANPDSMARALELIASKRIHGRRILVLGSMRELGEESETEHIVLGKRAAEADAAVTFFFGDETKVSSQAYQNTRSDGSVFWTNDIAELSAQVKSELRSGDVVLVKGSRGVELERLTEDLLRAEEERRRVS